MDPQTETLAASPATVGPASEVDTDDLIEDVSIDGMCGVY